MCQSQDCSAKTFEAISTAQNPILMMTAVRETQGFRYSYVPRPRRGATVASQWTLSPRPPGGGLSAGPRSQGSALGTTSRHKHRTLLLNWAEASGPCHIYHHSSENSYKWIEDEHEYSPAVDRLPRGERPPGYPPS